MTTCHQCDRPRGEDMESPVDGHCYGAWFIDWECTDCFRIWTEKRMKEQSAPAQKETP